MTKTKKTIMWSVLACLLVAGVAGGAIGVTYARYSSTGEGTGSATVAYWDVAVSPAESTNVSVYAAPSSAAYTSDSYSSEYARYTTSELITAATITNSGDVAATVEVSVTGNLSYTLRDGVSSETASEGASYLAAINDHFKVLLFQSTEAGDTSPSDLGGEVTLGAASVVSDVRTASYLYIYCELVWTSDISESCFGADADAFDTWIGTNVASIDFTLSYSAVQAA